MLSDMLNRLEKKERLRLIEDYVPLREALEQIDNSIAEHRPYKGLKVDNR